MSAPPLPPPISQDIEQLRLLGVFHYVVAVLLALFSLFPVVYLLIGLGLMSGRLGDAGTSREEAMLVGGFFVGIAVLFIVLGLATAVLIAYAGRCLRRRRRYTLCMVAAAVACLFMPVGTVLGIFTLIVLQRPGVRSLFA